MSDQGSDETKKPDLTDDEGKPLAYGSYLKVPQLLDLQTLRSEPKAHDELLFIIIHQAYELWFKLVIFELDSVRELMEDDDVYEASRLLQRVLKIEELLVQQIHILETMTPRDFLSFRAALKPASGFQSAQFREVEFLSGMKEGGHVMKSMQMLDEEKERLQKRLDEPSIRVTYYEMLKDKGYDVVVPQDGEPLDEEEEQRTLDALHEIYAAPEEHFHIYQLSESLVAHDQNILMWRFHHVRVVERLIGTKHGTGGSPGVKYLNSTLSKRAYPLLWQVRGMLSDEAFYGVAKGPTIPPSSE
ncbi:MAG: tryptophan 2,3-dioxygenase [Myxococcota bacterium]